MHQSSTAKALERRWSGVALLLFLSAVPIFGATITVTSTNDSGPGSLRAAIASAANGDTINFNVAGTIALSTSLTLGPSVHILGPGESSLTISGGNAVVVFIINAGANVFIGGVRITEGSSPVGGGISNYGTLTLANAGVVGNQGTPLGGGIFNAGNLTIINSAVSFNSVISTTSADDLLGGSSARGGGIYNLGGSLGGTVTLINSIVQVNTVGTLTVGALQGNGSGIYNDHGTVTLISSSVYANSPPTWAGASLMA